MIYIGNDSFLIAMNTDKLYWFNLYNDGKQKIYVQSQRKAYLLECVNFVGGFIYLLNENKERFLIQTNEYKFSELRLVLKTPLKWKLITPKYISSIYNNSIKNKFAVNVPHTFYIDIKKIIH